MIASCRRWLARCRFRTSTARDIRSAQSLYEAVAIAVNAFRQQPWTPPVPAAAPLTIAVAPPAVEHRVTIQKVRQWATSTATSPADRMQRERVRALLATR